jgi:chemotaxis protein histidine kinase CheA
MQTATDHNQDQFLKEVLGLFALEGLELVGQIRAALDELGKHSDPKRHAKLYESMFRGLTTLGGSAATVGLLDIEKLPFSLVPLVQRMQELGKAWSTDQVAVLRRSLDAIATAIQGLAQGGSGVIADLPKILEQTKEAAQAQAATGKPQFGSKGEAGLAAAIPTRPVSVIDTLRNLQKNKGEAPDATRHILDTVIERACTQSGGQAIRVEPRAIRSILRELDALDEWFLAEVQRRIPTLVGGFSEIMAGNQSEDEVERLLQEVCRLHEAAQNVQAIAIMQFLQGLNTFVTIVTQKRMQVSAVRLQAVAGRISMFARMVQHWVTLGQNERASIEHALKSAGLATA